MFTTAVSSTVFSSPGIEGVPAAGQQFNITVATDASVTEPLLRYRQLDGLAWRTCSITNNTCSLDGLDQGVYEYYFINGTNGSTRFPQDGELRLPLSDGIDLWKEKAQNLTTVNPSTSFTNSCTPWNRSYNSDETLDQRFSCGFEQMQGAMITGFGTSYLMTGNTTYLPYLRNLSLREYDETGNDPQSEEYATCDINNSDYRCSDTSDLLDSQAVTGARRQAALITSMARYGRLANQTLIRTAARNYMSGSPEGCNIWSGDFHCSTFAGQGAMTEAAWSAFIATGNETFRKKARKLAQESYSRSDTASGRGNYTAFYLIEGLLKTYEVTGNQSYRAQASMLARDDLPACSNRSGRSPCSVENQSQAIHTALTGYRTTGDHFYKQQAIDTLRTNFSAGSCNPWNGSYRCDWADEQGAITSAFWRAHRILPDTARDLANPRIIGKRQSGSSLTFRIDMTGDIPSASLELRKPGDSWQTCELWDFNQSCTVGANALAEQTVYEYRFTAGNLSFPTNGTFRFMLAHRNETLKNHAELMTENQTSDCYPLGTDFSCEEEHFQALMIDGFEQADTFASDDRYRRPLNRLATSEIGPDILTFCDHAENDFHCDPSVPPNGSLRQGTIIHALWKSWSQTGNATIRALALNYTRNHPEDCNVWQRDFTCGSQRGQGAMVQGYQEAYRATGNRTYLAIATNLSAAARGFTNITSERLGGTLWTQYALTNNTSFRNMTRNTTAQLLRACQDGSCSTVEYAEAFELGMSAFQSTVNGSYYNLSYNVLMAGNAGECNPWEGDYRCQDADEQGALISTFWKAFAYDRVSVDGDVTINTTSSSLTVGDTMNTTCSVTNTVANGSDLLDVNVTINATGFNVSGNSSRLLGDITPGMSENTSWELTAEASGSQEVRCTAVSSNGWTGKAVATVDVASPSTDEGGGGTGGGGGGPSGGSLPPPSPVTAAVNLSFGHQDTRSELATLLADRPGLADSLAALLATDRRGVNRSKRYTVAHTHCLRGVRNVSILDGTTSWLTVTYTCDTPLDRLLVYDRLPRNVTDAADPVTGAAAVTLDQQPAAYAFLLQNVTSGASIRIRYQLNGTANLSRFERPVAIMQNSSGPVDSDPPRIELFGIASFNTTRQFLRFTANVTDRTALSCNVTRNGVQELQRVSGLTGVNISLGEGLNRFRIVCQDAQDNVATKTFTVLRQEQETRAATDDGTLLEQLPLHYLQYLLYLVLAAVVLGAAGAGYRRRDAAIRAWRQRRLDRLVARLEQDFQDEDFVGVLDRYEAIKELYIEIHGEPPGIGFWHRTIGDLGMTLRIYLLLDLSVRRARKGEIDKVLDSLDNLQGLYSRFKQRNPSDELQERIEQKARELDQLLQRQVDARFNF